LIVDTKFLDENRCIGCMVQDIIETEFEKILNDAARENLVVKKLV